MKYWFEELNRVCYVMLKDSILQGFAIDVITSDHNFKNALTIVLIIFKSFTHNMNSPTKTPVNKERTVFFVKNTKPIASGGTNVKIPNLTRRICIRG